MKAYNRKVAFKDHWFMARGRTAVNYRRYVRRHVVKVYRQALAKEFREDFLLEFGEAPVSRLRVYHAG